MALLNLTLPLMYHRKTRNSKPLSPTERAIREGYRSGLEVQVSNQLKDLEIPFKYEAPESKINYVVNESRTYTPDFVLPNGIIIETKGRFTSEDRKKHRLIKEQCPDFDIRFVFTNSKSRISKLSNTTYGMWCSKLGFKYADGYIPLEWLKEKRKSNA